MKVWLEIVVRIYDTFDNNFGIKNELMKYLKEISWLRSENLDLLRTEL